MMVRPIRSEADYEASLVRLKDIMGATPGSAEADELEIIAALVERYEEETLPIAAPTPLAAIRFRMEQQGLEPRDLEPLLGSRSRVSEVLNGARPLSIDMIRALNQHLGIPAEVLIREDSRTTSKSTSQLSKPNEKQLVSWGILGDGETFSSLIARAFGPTPAIALLRKTRTVRTNAKTDDVALQAWCAAALLKSYSVVVRGSFDANMINIDVARSLAQLSVHTDGPLRARDALSELGIALVVLPHLAGTHLDGAALRRPDGVPVIALTLRRDRIDNFWFTLLHELAHVVFHLSIDQSIIIDDLEISSSEKIEREADDLAQVALISPEDWGDLNNGTYTSLAEIEDLARRAGVNVAIAAGRWQRENRDFRKFSKLLGHGAIRHLFKDYEPNHSP